MVRALLFPGLWLRALPARAPIGSVPGVAAGSAGLLVGLPPVAPLLVGERPIALEHGAELDRRHLGLRIHRIPPAVALRDRRAGKQKRRHCNKNNSHSSLDIDLRAAMRAKRRAPQFTWRARAGSVRAQRASGGRSRPSG